MIAGTPQQIPGSEGPMDPAPAHTGIPEKPELKDRRQERWAKATEGLPPSVRGCDLSRAPSWGEAGSEASSGPVPVQQLPTRRVPTA